MEKQGRSSPPGMHGFRRGRPSDYGVRLREKQKVKRYYGVLEKQFRIYFERAERIKGNTGVALLVLLESRLDNVIYKTHFAGSHRQARQVVAMGHILVNGHVVDIPSYQVKPGDKITVRNHDKTKNMIKSNLEVDANAPGAELAGSESRRADRDHAGPAQS